ncbi:MAG: trimethylamine methyltransferase family protein [Acidiferrobacterales bacterium]
MDKSSTPHRRRRSRRAGPSSPKDHAPPRSRPIVSHVPKLNILSEEQVEQIHEASLAILVRTGVVFSSEKALTHFRRVGARIEEDRVYIDRDLIMDCVNTAPAEYTLRARNLANDVTIGGDTCAVMPGGGPPFVYDLDGKRRTGTLADLENFARLSEMAPQVQVVARKAVEAQDVPVEVRHLDCWRAALTLTDKPVQSGFVHGLAEAEDVLKMLQIVFGGEDAISGTPVAHCSVNVNSPLHYDTPMLESLMAFARYGQAVLISPFVMAGVTGPTTLAGALAQQNAEVLAGLVLAQLVRPGAPVLYGTASSNLDMRSGAPAIGSPESAISIAVCAQLARRYGLPCRGGGALTDSPVPDAQSNYERMFTLLTSVLSGVNYLMHGVGILESYLTLSYEQFVIDLDLIDMVRQLVQPVDISPETLALDTINDIGPRGFYLDAAHTMRHYRDAFFIPQISVRKSYEQWQAEGAVDAVARANLRCRDMLASYKQPAMESAVADRLYDYVERRKAELLKN